MATDPDPVPPDKSEYAGFRITEMWLFTAIDPEDDEEGVVSFFADGVQWPLVAADPRRLVDWTRIAAQIAVARGVEVKISKMTVRETFGRIDPEGNVTYEKE